MYYTLRVVFVSLLVLFQFHETTSIRVFLQRNTTEETINNIKITDVTNDIEKPFKTEVKALVILTTICNFRQQNTKIEFEDFLYSSISSKLDSCSFGNVKLNKALSTVIELHIPCSIPGTMSPYLGKQIDLLTLSDEEYEPHVSAMMVYAINKISTYKNYNYFMMKLPNNAFPVAWSGLALTNCQGVTCYSWFNNPNLIAGIYVHELGHNFGLGHAKTPNSEYGDPHCAMGQAQLNNCYNAVHRDALGWSSPMVSVNLSSQLPSVAYTLTQNSQYIIANKLIYIEKFDDSVGVYLAMPDVTSMLLSTLSKKGQIQSFDIQDYNSTKKNLVVQFYDIANHAITVKIMYADTNTTVYNNTSNSAKFGKGNISLVFVIVFWIFGFVCNLI